MLSAEQSHHLASEAASEKMGNHRNGSSPKTVLSPGGELQLRQRVYIGLAAQQYVFDGGDGGFAVLLLRRVRRDLDELVYRIVHYRSPFSRLSKSTTDTVCHVFTGGTGAVGTNDISLAFLLQLVRPGYVTHSIATFKSMIKLSASIILPSK